MVTLPGVARVSTRSSPSHGALQKYTVTDLPSLDGTARSHPNGLGSIIPGRGTTTCGAPEGPGAGAPVTGLVLGSEPLARGAVCAHATVRAATAARRIHAAGLGVPRGVVWSMVSISIFDGGSLSGVPGPR